MAVAYFVGGGGLAHEWDGFKKAWWVGGTAIANTIACSIVYRNSLYFPRGDKNSSLSPSSQQLGMSLRVSVFMSRCLGLFSPKTHKLHDVSCPSILIPLSYDVAAKKWAHTWMTLTNTWPAYGVRWINEQTMNRLTEGYMFQSDTSIYILYENEGAYKVQFI